MLPWILVPPVTPSPDLLNAVGGHPLVARLLAQRGVDTPAKAAPFLDPQLYRPAAPDALLGVAQAAQLVHDAIARGDRLLIWGDFDVDGQTSTALLVTALRALAGDEKVEFHVPNRFEESHGIKVDKLEARLQAAQAQATPIKLLISCDTGIAEGPAVGFAKDQGLTVVITDHHDLSAEFQGQPIGEPLWGLPRSQVGSQSVRRADAIVNPKFLPLGDPLRTLPGVGVAYKLVQRLYSLAGRSGEEEELLDLVALGIVADVAEQVHDARYLLQRGLAKLRATRRAGLLALMHISRVEPAALTAESIGFQLGPRMNALGRLEDATVAVELLTTRDAIRAGQLAAKLERLNQDRRMLTGETTRAANEMIERDPSLLNFNALVLTHPNWHAGVVGIVASKLVERYGKPTVLLLNPPGAAARGSARSVPGVDIGSAIAACSSLLLSHGGHPGAAGMSLPPENIDAFRRELSRQVATHRDETVEVGLQIDAEMQLGELSLLLAEELARLAPFGAGNPMPQFVTYGLQIADDRRMGREGTHRKLIVRGSAATAAAGEALPVLWFGGADVELPAGPIDLAYTLNINDYKGERSLQLMYVDCRPAQPRQPIVASDDRPPLHVVDLRKAENSTFLHAALMEALAAALPAGAPVAWYAEGLNLEPLPAAVSYAPRAQLVRSDADQPGAQNQLSALVLWSIPPAPDLLRWLLETVRPAQVYLCGRYSADDALGSVLRAVARMCKFALNHPQPGEGPQTQHLFLLNLNRMAARLGSTEEIVRHALLWLEARGDIYLIEWLAGDTVRIAGGDGQARRQEMNQIEVEIEEMLAEVRAYRRFFQRAPLSDLNLRLAAPKPVPTNPATTNPRT